MDDMTAFERQLAAELESLVGPVPRFDIAAITRAAATQPPRWRFTTMFSALKLSAAAAIVALFGSYVLTGVLTQPRADDMTPPAGATATPESTTPLPIQLPQDIPSDVRSGTLETPFGPARWVHLTGDETSLPSEFAWLLSTQDGYVVPDSDWQTGTSKGLWRSPDLIHWAIEEPLGIQAGVNRIWRAGDTYWLSADVVRVERVSLWRSRDTRSWEQVSLEELNPPGPDGFAWQVVGLSDMVTYDGTTLVSFTWTPDHDVVLRELPGTDDLRGLVLVETAPGVFDVKEVESWSRGVLSEETSMTLRMEETERGLRVTDAADGRELMVLEGVSLEFVELVAVEEGSPMGNYAVDPVRGLAILDGEELLTVDLPQEATGCCSLALTADEGGFASYAIGPDGLVHVHRSQDGRAWRETDIIGDDADEPTGVDSVWAWLGDGSAVTVALSTTSGDWRGSNGRWERAPAPPDGDGFRIATGWIMGPVVQGQDRIEFIPDEGAPVSIGLSDLGIPFGDCGASEGLMSPNTLVSTLHEDCAGRREAWILTFDDLPASGSTDQ